MSESTLTLRPSATRSMAIMTGLTPAQVEGAPFVIEHLEGPEDTESHR